ncbi:MAG: hypothetical protein Q7R41_03715, partial [Phycisphaerales bacterium]|nr:hypothetical protein [Phycisphaerales bacterium]
LWALGLGSPSKIVTATSAVHIEVDEVPIGRSADVRWWCNRRRCPGRQEHGDMVIHRMQDVKRADALAPERMEVVFLGLDAPGQKPGNAPFTVDP